MIKQSKNHLKTFTKNAAFILLATPFMLGSSTVLASTPIANGSNDQVSFEFNDTPLKDIFQLLSNSKSIQIDNYDNVPDVNVSVKALKVSATQLQNHLLKCSGLALVSNKEDQQHLQLKKVISHEIISTCVAAFDA